MQMVLNWGVGLSSVIFNPINLLLLLAGTLLGMIVGALPGLNSPIAMSIMIPLTYGMDPGSALCILAGIYTGSTCGGSVSSILLEVPGTGAAVVTAFDGHEMYKKGQGGLALGISSVSSVVGGIVAAIVLGVCAPFVAAQALKFGAPEYLMLSVMGFASVIGMSNGRMSKNIMAMLIGLLISVVGISPQGGIKRFTFGTHALLEGIPLVPMLIGMFGIGSIISAISDMKFTKSQGKAAKTTRKKSEYIKMQYPDKKMIKSFLPIWAQSSVIGNVVGAIPGAGMTVAIFMAYDQVKRYRKDLKFGTGVPEGVAAPECANNSVVGSSMIPLLALGVPGNPASSLFLGALLIHGLRTGPKFLWRAQM
ncbi:MAG: tripartite tricarboxylate transporter permease [Clostridium sp.]|nr:tripartite tricarboxylate transporter permease [Clostridium sp.]